MRESLIKCVLLESAEGNAMTADKKDLKCRVSLMQDTSANPVGMGSLYFGSCSRSFWADRTQAGL